MLALSRPVIYTLELTPACNNLCPECSNSFTTRRTALCWSQTEWIALLQEIGPDAVRIRLTGGEPTLHPHFIPILETAAAYHAAVTIFTNGRWHDPLHLVNQIKRQSNIAGLLISLHGASAQSHQAFTLTPNSFAETTANIRLAIDQGLRVALSVVLNQDNQDEIEAICELGLQWGVDHIAFNRFMGPPQSPYSLNSDQMMRAVKIIGDLAAQDIPVIHSLCLPQCFAANMSEQCLAGIASICIDPWGNLRPCLYSNKILGSLQEHSLEDLWRGAALRQWREQAPAGCQQCSESEICFGGCRAAGELQHNRYDPLYREPIDVVEERTIELPASLRPIPICNIIEEPFGYALLGNNRFIAISPESLPVLQACDGINSFADLCALFSQPELELLGELWDSGMLSYIEED